jgi:hypothetical protein
MRKEACCRSLVLYGELASFFVVAEPSLTSLLSQLHAAASLPHLPSRALSIVREESFCGTDIPAPVVDSVM